MYCTTKYVRCQYMAQIILLSCCGKGILDSPHEKENPPVTVDFLYRLIFYETYPTAMAKEISNRTIETMLSERPVLDTPLL